MPPSQPHHLTLDRQFRSWRKRLLLFLVSFLPALVVAYPCVYAILRLKGYIVRGESCEYHRIMWGRNATSSRDSTSGASAAYLDGAIAPWRDAYTAPDPFPVALLWLFKPMIRAEFEWRQRNEPKL